MTTGKIEVKKVLIVTLSNLGDAVLTLPVFQAVISRFPGVELHAVVGEGSKPVFENDPRIQKLIVYDRKQAWADKFRFIFSIRKERYDLIIDLRHSLIGLAGGSHRRNAYLRFSRAPKHKGLKHLNALKGLLESEPSDISFLETRADAPGTSGSERLVAAAVGSKSDLKKWPAGYFAALLDRLAVEQHCRIVLVGDANDRKDCQEVKSRMSAPVLDLSGGTDFNRLCSVLRSAALLVTNDSAPLHIADSLKTPVLAIFGPTDPLKYGPRQEGSTAVRREVFCSPCERPQCRFAHECMKELGVDEVYSKAVRILNEDLGSARFKLLAIRLDRVGDVALSLPALQALRDRFPDASISVMTRPETAEIVSGHPAVDEVIPYFYERKGRHRGVLGNIRFLKEIARHRFDVCLILHPSVRSHLVPFAAGIPYRIGFDSYLPILLTRKVPDRRHLGLKHESEYALEIIRGLGAAARPESVPGVAFFSEHQRTVGRLLEPSGVSPGDSLIAVHAGSSSASKKWPVERYAQLISKVSAKTPLKIVVVGGSEETGIGAFLKKEVPDRIVDLTGRLGLKELAALLSRCEALISNDSGPVHIAAQAGIRTLVIYGRNKPGLNPERWKPLGEGHRALQKNVGCVICLADACTINFECLGALEVEDVFAALIGMLEEKLSIVKGS